jgi:hypothetical protein
MTATANPFPLPLILKRAENGKESSFGLPVYVLTAAFLWRSLVIPKGFATDLASIPKAFFLLDPDDPKWKRAAVVHDYACRKARDGSWSMKEADLMLYEAMRDCGASKVTAKAFYAWVRGRHLLMGDG